MCQETFCRRLFDVFFEGMDAALRFIWPLRCDRPTNAQQPKGWKPRRGFSTAKMHAPSKGKPGYYPRQNVLDALIDGIVAAANSAEWILGKTSCFVARAASPSSVFLWPYPFFCSLVRLSGPRGRATVRGPRIHGFKDLEPWAQARIGRQTSSSRGSSEDQKKHHKLS